MTQEEFEKYAREHDIFFCTSDMIKQMKAEIEGFAKTYGSEDVKRSIVLHTLNIISRYLGGKT